MLKFDLNILWTLINLVFFFLLMKLFLFKPIKKVLDKRQEIVDAEIENARKTNELADEKLADYESRIANVDSEAEQIVATAKDNAKAEYDKIICRAEDDAKQIREIAKKQGESEVQAMRRAAKEEIASVAFEAAEKIVGNSINDKTNSDIFDEFLNEGSVD